MDLHGPNALGPQFVQAGYPHNPDFSGASQEGLGAYQVTQKDGERFSAAKAYPAPSRARANLRVFIGAQTCRVLTQNQCAVGVVCLQQGQMRQLLAAREVLLCAGALQSPQRLMLSGIGPNAHLLAHSITPQHERPRVGQHLQYHMDVVQVLDAPQLKDSIGISPGGALKTRGRFLYGEASAAACSPATRPRQAASSKAPAPWPRLPAAPLEPG